MSKITASISAADNHNDFSNGIDGKKCLLLSICEAAKNSFLEANGVLGHVLHIIFT